MSMTSAAAKTAATIANSCMYITPEDYAAAKRNGIDKARIEYRVRIAGWSVKRAVRTPLRTYNRHGNWLNVARKNGIIDKTFHARLRYGWTCEEAATTPVLQRSEASIRKNMGGENANDIRNEQAPV